MTISEIIWINGLLQELNVKHEKPPIVFCDNKDASQISSNPMYHEMTKHIEIYCHFVREKLQARLIKMQHIGTKEQIVNVFTKVLNSKQQHYYLIRKLGIADMFRPMRLKRVVEDLEEQSDAGSEDQ